MVHQIHLERYTASHCGAGYLLLGTADSHGIERLHLLPGEGWEGLTLSATFAASSSTRVLADSGGVVEVPPEATAVPSPQGGCWRVVICGVAEGVQRISADLRYVVLAHAAVESVGSNPTPSVYEQFVSEVRSDRAAAEDAAVAAAAAGKVSADSARQAVQAAEDAATLADAAAQDADEVRRIAEVAALWRDAYYVHQQMQASDCWIIGHNLGKRPAVTVVDSAGGVVVGDVTYFSDIALQVRFASAFAGVAYLN